MLFCSCLFETKLVIHDCRRISFQFFYILLKHPGNLLRKPTVFRTFPYRVTCHTTRGTTCQALHSAVAFGPAHMSQTIRSHVTNPSHPNIHSSILSFHIPCNSFLDFFHSYNRGTTFPEPLLIRSQAIIPCIFSFLQHLK